MVVWGIRGGSTKGHEEVLGMMDVFIILTAVVVSRMCINFKTYKIATFNSAVYCILVMIP